MVADVRLWPISGMGWCTHYACNLESVMLRRFVTAIVTVVAFGISFGATASADPYKWCAVYGSRGGGTNCGFVTLEQCRAAISGLNGDCEINQFYTGPNEKPAKRTRKPRKLDAVARARARRA
jgi:hypothetical protein